MKFGLTNVLEDIDLVVPRGDFLGIIGPNGAGKSVLLRTILGLVHPDAGSVRVLGQAPSAARGRVGYVPQLAGFDRSFPISVLDVVLMGRLSRIPLLRRFSGPDREAALHALDRVNMGERARRQVGKLSGGEVQRVMIARALAVEAEILLLDEPTASLDPQAAHDLYDLLEERAESATIVLVSHDVGVMSDRVRRVVCLNRRLVHDSAHGADPDALQRTYGHRVSTVEHDHPFHD
ncbi:MAG: ABC transporter ATP-binding protein [Candidatus Eisenbacteria bacterium]